MSNASAESLTPRARSVLTVMCVTLFIDLVGFSIIFPLYPSMLEYYRAVSEGDGLMGMLLRITQQLETWAGPSHGMGSTVLFGGLLGSVYSLLQFLCAPMIGRLSDRYGRRPILIISTFGTVLSYLIWFFAGSFEMLVLSRFVGGVMSGNIATASAVVADVTSSRNRSKGMALIGLAFGLGFIGGPAIGGFSATINLSSHFPAWAAYGVNPYSTPALVALILAVVNLGMIWRRFPETLPEGNGARVERVRTINPIALFHVVEYPGVTRTNIAYFLYLTTFSGMEFSLSFLAAERFHWGPKHIALMMLFVGVVLALVQGGYVRRRADLIGPRRMSLHGLLTLVPALLLIGFSESWPFLYLGLLLMAMGSAQILPCMTALVSLYTPEHEQGRVLGVFRSLGALARAAGPLLGCVLYWQFGAATAFGIVAAFMAIPIWITVGLPRPEGRSHAVVAE